MHALRAFEAAARHLSFSRAAEELNLTHGAVSHALRNLEAELATPLFRRKGNAMLLTDAGQRLASHVRDALARLERGLDDVRGAEGARQTLTVSVLPAFAAHWLLPRLAGFYALHPEIDVVLRATPALADLSRDEADVAIRYGPGCWPGLASEKLMDEEVFPVCSPGFLDRHPVHEPADLLRVTLLRDVRQPWEDWFRSAGLAASEPDRGPSYNDAGLLLQSAAAGHGVALARGHLVQEELEAGRLVRLFPDSARASYAYFVVLPQHRAIAPKVRAFTQWLGDQVAAETAAQETGGS